MSLVRLALGLGAAGLGALVVAGCVSTEETAPIPDPYATEAQFCKLLAEALCNKAVVDACYLSSDATRAEDTSKCVAAASQPARCNGSGLPYDKKGAQACIAAAKKAYADAKLTVDDIADYYEACLAVFSAGGPVGSQCNVDSDCDGGEGLRCLAKPGEDGTCQEPEEVGPGLSCAAENQICEEGFYCGSDDACIQRPKTGESCSETKPCDDGSLCPPGDETETKCEAKKGNGEACTDGAECSGGFCVKAEGASDGTCGAQLVLAPTTAGSCTPFL